MAGIGAFSALSTNTVGEQSLATTRTAGDSYHPGPPRVMHAGERLVDPLTPDYKGDGSPDGRRTLSPRIPEPQRDPDSYGSEAFTWKVVETPVDSDLSEFYSNPDEYDYGTDNVEEFDPDVPGTYTLELEAPDGTHRLTIRVFPEPSDGAAGPPRVEPVSEYDDGEDQSVEPGETVSLQAIDSEDPNGGTLSFQWEQTSGPEVELTGANSVGTAFMAPQVEGKTTLTFELIVDDGQGKTATDTVNVTVQPETGGATTTPMDGEATTKTDSTAEATTDTGDGDGPGFGLVSGVLGTAGGAAYAARSLLGDVAEQGADGPTDGES
jgi:hypothetical protein